MITLFQLAKAIKGCNEEGLKAHFPSILATCEDRQINTPQRLAAFLANAAHETGGFKKFVENLTYSKAGLLATWPSRFTPELAAKIERNPILIANHVYSGRYGNNEPGDGWKYRGRGMFQTTFKDNYSSVSKALGYDFVKDPDKLTEPPFAAKAAGFYWNQKKLNQLADIGDIKTIRRQINGALKGYEEVLEYYEKILEVLT